MIPEYLVSSPQHEKQLYILIFLCCSSFYFVKTCDNFNFSIFLRLEKHLSQAAEFSHIFPAASSWEEINDLTQVLLPTNELLIL